MKKICNKCKEDKDRDEFHKDKYKKDGLHTICKLCRKNNDKEVKHIYDKKWYTINRKKKLEYIREYRKNNPDKRKQYLTSNKNRISKQEKEYRANNKDVRVAYLNSNAKYHLYADKLTIDESPRLAKDNISLEVVCKYCGKYFIPTTMKVINRIGSLNGNCEGDCFIYCSDGCKDSCPIYRKIKYPKGFKKASSREVNSLVRQMCFERDNWECQICGKTQNEAQLHCHHIEGYAQNPLVGNDIYNVITLCKQCHKMVHKLPKCNYYELSCNKKQIGEIK
jgi:hypothetical protein